MCGIAVIGSGIAGLSIAKNVDFAEVHLYEYRLRVGSRKHCTGIVSLDTISRLNAWNFVENCYREVHLYLGKLRAIFYSSKPFVCRIDREAHEVALAKELVDEGHKLFLSKKVIDIAIRRRGVEITYVEGSTVKRKEYRYVVIAEGYPGYLSRKLGFAPKMIALNGLQYRLKLSRAIPEHVTDKLVVLYGLDHRNGYAWLVPVSRRDIIVGIAMDRRGREALSLLECTTRKFLHSLGVDYTSKELFGGIVLRGHPRNLVIGKVYTIGDCVSMVKSFSGGGLYPISIASRAIAKSIRMEKADKALQSLSRELKTQYVLYVVLSKALRIAKKSLSRELELWIPIDSSRYDRHEALLFSVIRDMEIGKKIRSNIHLYDISFRDTIYRIPRYQLDEFSTHISSYTIYT